MSLCMFIFVWLCVCVCMWDHAAAVCPSYNPGWSRTDSQLSLLLISHNTHIHTLTHTHAKTHTHTDSHTPLTMLFGYARIPSRYRPHVSCHRRIRSPEFCVCYVNENMCETHKNTLNRELTFEWRWLVGWRVNQFGFHNSIFSQNPLQKSNIEIMNLSQLHICALYLLLYKH